MTPVYARIEAVSRPRLHLTDVIPAVTARRVGAENR
jgi:hypothetical protein